MAFPARPTSDKNGWLMASEFGRYVSQQVVDQSKGSPSIRSLRSWKATAIRF